MTAPPGSETSMSRPGFARYLFVAARLLVGYILAVAVGSLVGAITGALVPGFNFLPDSTGLGRLADILNTAFMYFTLGVVFGLPYAAAGTFVFWRWLPKSMLLFLVIGMLCPSAAILLTLYAVGTLHWLGGDDYSFMAMTMPAGLVAAYIYGAIGMGYGFGRWRFG